MKPDLKKLLLPYGLPDPTPVWTEWLHNLCDNIEKLEAEAVEVWSMHGRGYSTLSSEADKYRTWIFPSLTEKIKRGVTKDEIVEALEGEGKYHSGRPAMCRELANRIKAEGILP